MTQRSAQENLRQGIDAAKRGDKLAARRHLQQVLIADRNNEVAWMWMASVVDTLDERRRCLERALQINPNNERAREALRRLGVTLPGGAARVEAARESGGEYVGRQGVNIYLIAAGAVLVLVVGLIIASAVTNLSGTPTPAPAVAEATFVALLDVTPSLTPTPENLPPTETPLPGVIVTFQPEVVVTLPPTFTPTPTFTPSLTPTPTETPLPLESFSVVFSDLASQEANPALFSTTGAGTEETTLNSTGFSDVKVSPDGGRIAFVRTVTYDSGGTEVTAPELFVASIDALDEATQLTQLGGTQLVHPDWSPDGAQLVFASDLGGDFELYLMSSSGGATTPLTENEAVDTDPAFSPDGSRIAFTSDLDSPGLTEIYTIAPDGTNRTRITDASGNNYDPAWSPDGTQIAFVSDRGGQGDIFVMEANGNTQRLLTIGDGDAESRLPTWSPDGRWIAFASNRVAEGADLKFNWFLMDTRGENVRPLVITDREPQSLSFLPLSR